MSLPWFFAVDHLPTGAAASLALGDGALSGGAATMEASNSRVQLRSSGDGGHKTIPTTAQIVVGARMKLGNFGSGAFLGIRAFGASSDVIDLHRASQELRVRVGATVYTPAVAVEAADFTVYFWEMHCVAHASAGSVTVRKDGVEVFTVSGIDTLGTGGSVGYSRVAFNPNSEGNLSYYTDLYIREAPESGNPFYGPILLRYLKPASDVQAQWTPNAGTDNFNRLNQAHDGDTTYVESDTLGDEDIYTLDDLPAGVNSVIAVVPVAVSVAPSGGAPQVELGIETAAGVVQTGERTVGVSNYQTQMGDAQVEKPGGGGWSIAAVNELKLRLKAV